MNKKYTVDVTSTNTYEIEADSPEEAEQQAIELFGKPDGVTEAEAYEEE